MAESRVRGGRVDRWLWKQWILGCDQLLVRPISSPLGLPHSVGIRSKRRTRGHSLRSEKTILAYCYNKQAAHGPQQAAICRAEQDQRLDPCRPVLLPDRFRLGADLTSHLLRCCLPLRQRTWRRCDLPVGRPEFDGHLVLVHCDGLVCAGGNFGRPMGYAT
jgi:hypothetical protein